MSADSGVIFVPYEITDEERARLIAKWREHRAGTVVVVTPSERYRARFRRRRNWDRLWAALALLPSVVLAYWFYGVRFIENHGIAAWPISAFFILLWCALAFCWWRALSRPATRTAPAMSKLWWFVWAPILALCTFAAVVILCN